MTERTQEPVGCACGSQDCACGKAQRRIEVSGMGATVSAHRIVRLDGGGMTPAERRFKELACEQVALMQHPTPTSMNRALGHGEHNNDLGGKQVKWLRDVVAPKRKLTWDSQARKTVIVNECTAICCDDHGYIPVVARPADEVRTPDGDHRTGPCALEPELGSDSGIDEYLYQKRSVIDRILGFFR